MSAARLWPSCSKIPGAFRAIPTLPAPTPRCFATSCDFRSPVGYHNRMETADRTQPPASDTPTGISCIGQIGITVTDVQRAVTFYRDVLGLRFLFQVPNMGFFDCGGIRLMLSGSETSGETHSSILYYKVADIAQAFQSLQERGVTFDREPQVIARMPDHDLWMAFFRDPDRNVLALMSEVPRSEKLG
jgi:methylmalonyl-CoA/ethylmalonyl-CoA epimerase